MKYQKFILLLLVFAGCEKLLTIEQKIKNNTGHTITIKTYETVNENGKILDSIRIAPNKSFTKTIRMGTNLAGNLFIISPWADSVNIIFDNEKIIAQTTNFPISMCNDLRSIFCISEYEYEDMGKRSSRYTYTITEEDYNNAIPFE